MMDEEANHLGGFAPLDYSFDDNKGDKYQGHSTRAPEGLESNLDTVDYMSNNTQPQHISIDKLSFADVMHFADFGPKLALNHQSNIPRPPEEDSYFSKFQEEGSLLRAHQGTTIENEDDEIRFLENVSAQMGCTDGSQKTRVEAKNRRKRPRSVKTSEEAESQRMTHIAVERNRRKQMNEHLRVLRSLMPSSYVQRGDHASIIGGAIEFVRELEQLLQCLESQKRRRLFGGDIQRGTGDAPVGTIQQSQPSICPTLPIPSGELKELLEFDPNSSGLREEMAENKSCIADVEVRMLGYDAMIKILSRRRPGQLLKIIAALEDVYFTILHTNITTIEQTILYSFNIKITSETRCSAEDLANSVQQILSFIDANTL